MKTELIKIDGSDTKKESETLKRAGELIRAGELVAFPTETVYGLGADALNADAAAKIYAAKGRPSDNPLIVHIVDFEQVEEIAEGVTDRVKKLMHAFWPGPMTMILPKKDIVPDGTTGGLSTVAIRMPSHPVARAFIRESGRMIAAPSANTSGRPSPSLAQHVYDDLHGKIPMILDGGPVDIGIESTIIDMTGEVPMILRPGYISKHMLEEVLGEVKVDPVVSSHKMLKNVVAKAPGMKYKHYAPKGQLILVEGEEKKVAAKINEMVQEKIREGYLVGVITTKESQDDYVIGFRRCIGSREDPVTISANLYKILREFDEYGAEYMYSESFFSDGLGNAIMNRMLKAAGYHLITV
ncbi:MAG: L-threonylcarbamoyladenylate synthase [Lachnospiraceae bacterium]|nr:L-threonylcarbamoyladenylate synthase [Lachnospiraceae bacterium]